MDGMLKSCVKNLTERLLCTVIIGMYKPVSFSTTSAFQQIVVNNTSLGMSFVTKYKLKITGKECILSMFGQIKIRVPSGLLFQRPLLTNYASKYA